MLYRWTNDMTLGCSNALLALSLIAFTLCSADSSTTTTWNNSNSGSTIRVFDGITEASVVSHFISNNSRAINSTGLWSKYNLIVKPSVVSTTASSPVGWSVGLSTTPESRYRPVDISIEDSDDENEEEDEENDSGIRDQFQDDSEDDDDSQEEDNAGEEDDYYASSTTQRTSHRPTQHKRKPKPRPPTPIIHQVIPQPAAAPVKPLVAPLLHPPKVKGGKIRKTRKKSHIKLKGLKKLKKYMLPLLLAYKLKFFTLIPLLLGGLVVIVASTGFAGFFFALFAVGVGLKKD